MRERFTNQFDRMLINELCEEFCRYNALGHTAILCSRPDFIRQISYDDKHAIAAHYATVYAPDDVSVDSVDRANAHLAVELQRGAFLLSTFATQQLRAGQRDDLLAVVRGSHRGSARDTDFSRIDFAHRLIQASPATHADAQALRLSPDIHRAH